MHSGPDQFTLANAASQTDQDRLVRSGLGALFEDASGSTFDKLQCFTRFVPRQALSLMLARHEAFKHALPVHGSIVECGVFAGAGLFTWAQLSAIYEPVNHTRKIVGFDSFSGFPELAAQDQVVNDEFEHKTAGSYAFRAKDELERSVALYDLNRAVGHIPKIELIAGNACRTIPEYLNANPHLVVSLLSLDFDLYEATRVALRTLLPRMPKGAVIVFDELNQKQWPGETLATIEELGLRSLRLTRLPYTPAMSYAVLE